MFILLSFRSGLNHQINLNFHKSYFISLRHIWRASNNATQGHLRMPVLLTGCFLRAAGGHFCFHYTAPASARWGLWNPWKVNNGCRLWHLRKQCWLLVFQLLDRVTPSQWAAIGVLGSLFLACWRTWQTFISRLKKISEGCERWIMPPSLRKAVAAAIVAEQLL